MTIKVLTTDRLVTENQGFVVVTARKYARKGIDIDDLVSEGNIALIEAAEKFDASQGKSFIAYAAPFVNARMKAASRQHDLLYKIPKDEPSEFERKRAKRKSLDAPLKNNGTASLLHVVEDKDAEKADEMLQGAQDKDALLKAIEVLNEREHQVITCFYGMGKERLTMDEIGKEMGLKRERVRQIRNTALRKLRRMRQTLLE